MYRTTHREIWLGKYFGMLAMEAIVLGVGEILNFHLNLQQELRKSVI